MRKQVKFMLPTFILKNQKNKKIYYLDDCDHISPIIVIFENFVN